MEGLGLLELADDLVGFPLGCVKPLDYIIHCAHLVFLGTRCPP